jgi:hypothetical protein
MKTELPAPEEYYRLIHAKKLRRQALWLETAEGVLGVPAFLIILVSVVGFPAVFALPWVTGVGLPGLLLWPAGLLLIIGAAVAALVKGLDWCELTCQQWRDQADRLEAEHQGRYGRLPAGAE